MQAAAPLMSLASVGLGAVSSIAGASGQAAADNYKAQVLNREAEYGMLAATQTNATMTRELGDTLSRIDAVRSASHDRPGSPTGAEVRGQTEYLATEQKGTKVENLMQQATLDNSEAAYLRSAASSAMLSGEIGAGADIFKGLGGAFSSLTSGAGGFSSLFKAA